MTPTSISRTAAERIGAAIHLVRPDWPAKQIVTMIVTSDAALWPPRDLFVALAYVALDRTTEGTWASDTPYRVLTQGPWYAAMDSAGGVGERQRALAESRHRKELSSLRSAEIDRCQWCGSDPNDRATYGRLPNGHLCPHTDPDERAAAAKSRADFARSMIRPAPPRLDRSADHDTEETR